MGPPHGLNETRIGRLQYADTEKAHQRQTSNGLGRSEDTYSLDGLSGQRILHQQDIVHTITLYSNRKGQLGTHSGQPQPALPLTDKDIQAQSRQNVKSETPLRRLGRYDIMTE